MIDRRAFLKDLRTMESRVVSDIRYNPEKDVAHLVSKYNLGWRVIWKQVKKDLTL